ncbi:MAG: hypothetical protein NZM18_01030 [Thermoflexales bacterium]|nr:hypothetical protein [Thermoflexales bacterium]MDW8351163.1 hypothetical protein [Anaerolineae bacterium]
MNRHSGRIWRDAAIAIAVLLATGPFLFAVVEKPQGPAPAPLQSPLQSPIEPTPPPAVPTPSPPDRPATATPPLVSTPERAPDSTATPDMRSTSNAVIATLTAQAIPPTFPPVPTPRPVGAGPEQTAQPPRTATPLPDLSGITLLSLSDKVYAGGAGTLTIRTRPDAVCHLQIERARTDGYASQRAGILRRAGSNGVIAWVWAVDAGESPGMITLLVDCGAAGAAQYQIEVVK